MDAFHEGTDENSENLSKIESIWQLSGEELEELYKEVSDLFDRDYRNLRCLERSVGVIVQAYKHNLLYDQDILATSYGLLEAEDLEFLSETVDRYLENLEGDSIE